MATGLRLMMARAMATMGQDHWLTMPKAPRRNRLPSILHEWKNGLFINHIEVSSMAYLLQNSKLTKLGIGSILALFAACLLGCGGGGSSTGSSSAPPPLPTWLAGAWLGTGASSGVPIYTLILPSGATRVLSAGNLAEQTGTLTLSRDTLSGTGTTFLAANLASSPTGNSFPAIFGGTATQFPAQMTLIAGTKGVLAIDTYNLGLDSAANIPVQLATLAGTYTAANTRSSQTTSTSLDATLTVQANGTLSGSDSDGKVSGTLTQVAANLNAFNVVLNYTPTGTANAAAFTGLAYYRPAQTGASAVPASLLVMTDTGQIEFSGIFTLNP